ncbi:hypothetical protein N783_20255 [Pontibacillus marinus BH030004 = DSM 16465]|uniref:3D domain-containing protein n=1 Tax=Pontibacillus marinus BH030004 = DSM 16465 TaxID=1385511 RepID=A0A0A5HK14_9BACI|nr:3D domain-containing protein [Pontibacillus marinus]KGX83952.1 hypothetical protein N783_20255 [Pontibacillus marinus BH030004 = DSM 16465]
MKTNIMKIVTAASVLFGYIGFNAYHVYAFDSTANEKITVDKHEQEKKATAFLSTELPEKKIKLDKKEAKLNRDQETDKKSTKDKQTKEKQSSDVVRTLQVEATAYTAFCEGCSGITRTGQNLRKNPDQKIIAVDPDVIPLGSKVHVEGYGTAIAGDIGSAIQGNRIDVFIPSQSKAMEFGRRHDVTVKILSRA